jgi:hypothetical protein
VSPFEITLHQALKYLESEEGSKSCMGGFFFSFNEKKTQ